MRRKATTIAYSYKEDLHNLVTEKRWRSRFIHDYMNQFSLAPGQTIDLVIILTALSDPMDHTLPDEEGVLRLQRGIQALDDYPHAVVDFIDLYRDFQEIPLNLKYAGWFMRARPDLKERIRNVGGTGDSTIMDLVSEAEFIQEKFPPGSTIAIPTDWEHIRRTAPTLYSLGYRVVWLKVIPPKRRNPKMELLGFLYSFLDPRWSGGWGKHLAKKAQQNAERYRERTRSEAAHYCRLE